MTAERAIGTLRDCIGLIVDRTPQSDYVDEVERQALAALDSLLAEVGVLAERTRQSEQERDLAVKVLPVEGWNLLMEERDVIGLELDRYGIDREQGVQGLLRHIYNNRDAAHGAAMLAVDGWQERANASETQLAAAREALTKYGKHREHCDRYQHDFRIKFPNAEPTCLCGYAAALAGEAGPPPPPSGYVRSADSPTLELDTTVTSMAVLAAPTENVGAPEGETCALCHAPQSAAIACAEKGLTPCSPSWSAREECLWRQAQAAPRSGASSPSAAPSSTDCETELAVCRAALTDLRRQMEEYRDQGDWPLSKVVDERDAAVEALHRCREDFHAKVSALQAAARAPSSTDGEKP